MHETDEFEDGDYAVRPNKSELKREAEALVELGKRLAELDRASLTSLELPTDLFEAIEAVKSIRSNSARKRQFKLIGKILRGMETGELERWIADRDQHHRKGVSEFHEVERWRDRLIQEGPAAMSEFLAQHPDSDRQRLNQLIRGAVRETENDKPPKSARQLFKYLKEII